MRTHRERAQTVAALIAIASLAAYACGSGRSSGDEQPERTVDARPPVEAPAVIADAGPPIDAGPAVTALPGSDSDERRALAEAGAVSAWRAVVNRSRYLARREQRGAIYGRILGQIESEKAAETRANDQSGPDDAGPPSPAEPARALAPEDPAFYWLMDETDGSGSLTVRLAMPPAMRAGHHPADTVRAGTRLVAWGAWQVASDSQWFWQADELAWLPDRAWSLAADKRAVPGHVIVDIKVPPASARPVSEIENRGGYITFQVVRASLDPADGWEIADKSKDRPVARLYLPGEKESYGAQDWRTAEEHWRLERGVRYTVRLKRFLPAKEGELPLMRALDAPRRVIGKKRRKARK